MLLGPKYQRGSVSMSVHANAAQQGAAGGVTPSVSDIIVFRTSDTGFERAGVAFNVRGAGSPLVPSTGIHDWDGLGHILLGVDQGGSPPIDHTGEWTDSTDGALLGSPESSLWEVACTSITSGTPGTWDVEAAAVGDYVSLEFQRGWYMNRVGGKGRTPGTDDIIAVFRIREIADTGNFTEFEVNATAVQT